MALLLLGAGAAHAQPPWPEYPLPRGVDVAWPGMDAIRNGGTGVGSGGTQAALATRNALRTVTANQTRALVAGDTLRSAATWVVANGRKYSGGLLIGATVITTALSWFYEEAQRSTGTDLDNWWDYDAPTGTYPTAPLTLWSGTPGSSDVTYGPASADRVPIAATYLALGGTPYNTQGLVPLLYLTNPTTFGSEADCGFLTRRSQATLRLTRPDRSTDAQYVVTHPYRSYCPPSAQTAVEAIEYRKAQLESLAVANWFAVLQAAPPQERPSLLAYLDANPAEVDSLRDILRQHADDAAPELSDPHTFAQPFPNLDVTFQPPLSWPIWRQDPYADRDSDTDGDGWPDWLEARLGTNPFDANSRPLGYADPDGDGRTNEQEAADLTDPLDPDDYEATTTPEADPDAPTQREDLLALLAAIQALEASLAGVSTEDRQVDQLVVAEQQLGELRAIADQLSTTGEVPPDVTWPDVEAMLYELPEVALTPPDPPTIDVATEVGDRWDPLMTAAQGKAPFAYLSLLPDPGSPSFDSTCPTFQVGLFGMSEPWDLCDHPGDPWMSTTGRAALTAFLTFFFLVGVVRRVVTT